MVRRSCFSDLNILGSSESKSEKSAKLLVGPCWIDLMSELAWLLALLKDVLSSPSLSMSASPPSCLQVRVVFSGSALAVCSLKDMEMNLSLFDLPSGGWHSPRPLTSSYFFRFD